MKNNFMQKICFVFLSLFITISLLGCSSTNKNIVKEKQNIKTENVKTDSTKNEAVKNKKIINDFQGVADYIHKNGRLPDNFITKEQAAKLGWTPGKDLDQVAPGKSIGGDIFTNAEKSLPDAPKRVWRECDINYNGGKRGADRILYSNDGLIYSTSDHYKTFKLLYNGK
ncbi:ribonuclease domain-containing protein [Clostridium sp. OS1-26]|uniref:ribonuclease domain-containing protein n=1 Tax=Clostridium sp. OS1-26 TaxID=3070681 RepID=UPI0027DFB1AC|nr:ribonuclease domain-containing protein [Clostridium sp. OS1-26]WML33433.1 ribonuclease domain-containing protein [Clostridium sp. OS1-26]